MATKQPQSGPFFTGPTRTKIVWASFAAAMTLVVGMLSASDRETHHGFLATNLGMLNSGEPAADPVFQTAASLDRERWKGIVIHHLGAPAGDAETIHRRHLGYGYQGLGYHFLIGNGNGLGDGVIHAGYRWNDQLPGMHAIGQYAEWHNHHSISICLIGNGDRTAFTDRQMTNLVQLVKRLQAELDIPAEQVYLHREVAEGTRTQVTSPGRFFPASLLREQLR